MPAASRAVARNMRGDRGDSPGPLFGDGRRYALDLWAPHWAERCVGNARGAVRRRSTAHHACGFAAAAGASEEVTDAIALAVSETVTNVIVHAYDGEEGEVRVSCRC